MTAYRERPVPLALADLAVCTWTHTATEAVEPEVVRVLPDGCVDLVWRPGAPVEIAGPDTGPVDVALAPGAVVVGLRLRTGAAAAVLGLPADTLRDARVPLEAVWGPAADRLAADLDASAPAAAADVLVAALRGRRDAGAATDPLVRAALGRAARAGARVDGLAAGLGVGERQLRRRFVAAVGYGPRTYQRVARLGRLLAAVDAGAAADGLARVALDVGYADQAHMTRECVRLTGRTPAALVRARRGDVQDVRNVQDAASAPPG